MERTDVFNEEGGGCNSGVSKLVITALLPGIMGGGRSLDPNLLLLLNNGDNNQGMWGGGGIWRLWILLMFGLFRNGWSGFGSNGGSNTCNALPWKGLGNGKAQSDGRQSQYRAYIFGFRRPQHRNGYKPYEHACRVP